MGFFCPVCGAPEASRERRPNGDSRCADGHLYASAVALDEPIKTYVALNHVEDKWRKYARPTDSMWVIGAEPLPSAEANSAYSRIMSGLGEALLNVEGTVGPLAIAVANHHLADQLADIFCAMKGPWDQGVRVVPFGASALSFCGPGTMLFRALLVIPPREGPITHNTFVAWVDSAFKPYLSPNAKVITL